jgi:hypothetical protein
MKINEGLLEHDLDYTVMPLISIDEYQSKIDDRKAIVAGFYVTENDPAIDLAAFIEKGVVKVLDTDVSPAPTEDGHYLVFIELDRNKDFPAKLLKIVDELKNIVNVDKWQFSPLHSKEDKNYNLTLGELRKRVNLDPDSVEISDDDEEDETHTGETKMENNPEITEKIGQFLKNALLERYSIENNILILEQYGYQQAYNIVTFDSDESKVPIMIGTIGDQKLFESNRLQNMLGQYYSVYSSGTHLIVTDYDNYVLLTPVD